MKAKKKEFILRIHTLGESHLADWLKYKLVSYGSRIDKVVKE